MAAQPPQLDDRERVRDASDIVRVVGEMVSLRPKGREYVGLCPFHDDHNPSMAVVPEKQIFHCFVCETGGDVFSFVQKYHAMDFREALEYLASRAGIELGRAEHPQGARDPHDPGRASTRKAIIEANRRAAEFFARVLEHPEQGAGARALLERRGICGPMIERFAIGAAPQGWDTLGQRLHAGGIDPSPFLAAGLLKARDRGSGHYDTMRHRLIFPIRDQIGRVIAFGGRRIDDQDEPKYLNSPEHAAFRKSATLYGLHEASRAIQRHRCAVITEGYTDVIACHQSGFEHAVATLGTALTSEHASLLRRLCETVILLFDSDQAGQMAADRAAEVFFAEPIDVRIATLARHTDAKDPDELLLRDGGSEVFSRVLDQAQDLLEFRYGALRERVRGLGPAAEQKAVEQELETLGRLGLSRASPLRRQFVLRRLVDITGLPERVVAGWITRSGRASTARTPTDAPARSSGAGGARSMPPAWWIVGCVLCDPELAHAISRDEWSELGAEAYGERSLGELVRVIIECIDRSERCTLGVVLGVVGDPDAQASVVALHRRVETETEGDPDRVRALWSDCVARRRRDRELARAGGSSDVVDRLLARRRAHSLGRAAGGDHAGDEPG